MRTTIYLDDDTLDRLRREVPPRGLSQFINAAVVEKLAAIERKRIDELAKEGYLATAADRDKLNKDWEIVDLENWPE